MKIKVQHRGFTLVELLIAIVVITILVAISFTSYNAYQIRSQNAKRSHDLSMLLKAIHLYKAKNGVYPPVLSSYANTIYGWDSSATAPTTFLKALTDDGIISTVPKDPVNDDSIAINSFGYRYYKYAAGTNGCDPARGEHFVLVGRARDNNSKIDGNQGFSCSGGRSWNSEGSWVVGGFTQ